MTVDDWRRIKRLAQCTFLPGSWDKKFAHSLDALASAEDWYCKELSAKQREWLDKLMHKYRKQLSRIPDPITHQVPGPEGQLTLF